MTHDRTTVDHVDHRINRLGSSLLFDPTVLARAADLGVTDPVALYAGGRAGVMGAVTAAQVRAAFGFFPPEVVAELWPGITAAGPLPHLAEVFVDAVGHGARARWDATAVEPVARLGQQIVGPVVPLGLSLFAGWQARPVPADPFDAAARVVMALRELRGDIHLQQVASAGLHPLEAEIVTRGEPGAELHGWPRPYPDPERHREAVARAEDETGRRMAAHHAALTPTEHAELAAAIDALDPTAL